MTGNHHFASTTSSTQTGFTLIELLVVISIIALLVGILLPALGAARKSAMSLQCLTQERQFGMGLSMFADDHKGFLPKAWFNSGPTRFDTSWGFKDPDWGWDFILWDGYLGRNTQVFRDPADDGETTTRHNTQVDLPASYRYNISDLPGPIGPYEALRVDDLPSPSESIRILDGAAGKFKLQWHHVATWESSLSGLVGPTLVDNVALDRHPGNPNYTFADGHAASTSWIDTWKGFETLAEASGQQTMWRQNFDGRPDRY